MCQNTRSVKVLGPKQAVQTGAPRTAVLAEEHSTQEIRCSAALRFTASMHSSVVQSNRVLTCRRARTRPAHARSMAPYAAAEQGVLAHSHAALPSLLKKVALLCAVVSVHAHPVLT